MNTIAFILILLMEQQTIVFEHASSITNPPEIISEAMPLTEHDTSVEFLQLSDLNERVKKAQYPRIGQSWSAAENMGGESAETSIARHGLYFAGAGSFGFQWKINDGCESTELQPESVEKSRKKRARLLEKNPNMVMLCEIRYYDALPNTYPSTSPYWQHDHEGGCVVNELFRKYDRTDYTNVEFQAHVAQQAHAVMASGAVDGVMLDWWDGHNEKEQNAKLQLLEKVRQAVGPEAVIIINTNESRMPLETTKLVNGYYIESYKTGIMHTPDEITEEWKQLQKTLTYSEELGREPHVNMLETWWDRNSSLHRDDLPRMRATTAMVMAQSNGYALFADPNLNGVTNGHEHNWYPFWNAKVGKPVADGNERDDGSYLRKFENATVLSNATGDKPVTIKFARPMKRVSNNMVLDAGQEATVEAHDGEIFLIGE